MSRWRAGGRASGRRGPVDHGEHRWWRDAACTANHALSLRVPGICDTLMCTMTIGSGMASAAVLAQADLAIQPDANNVGFLEFHQIDRARQAGRIATCEVLPQIMALVHH